MPEIMPRPAHADILHDLDADCLVCDLDPANAAKALAKHVIVDDQGFEAETEKRGMHACGLIHHVQTRQSRHDEGASLLISGLRVGHLRVGHARGGAPGKPVMLEHLRTGGRQQPLLTRTARHRAGPQVGHERPGADDAGVTRPHRIDIDQTCDDFSQRLCHRTCDGRRRRGTGLSG